MVYIIGETNYTHLCQHLTLCIISAFYLLQRGIFTLPVLVYLCFSGQGHACTWLL